MYKFSTLLLKLRLGHQSYPLSITISKIKIKNPSYMLFLISKCPLHLCELASYLLQGISNSFLSKLFLGCFSFIKMSTKC